MDRDRSLDISVVGRNLRVADCKDFDAFWRKTVAGEVLFRNVSSDDFVGLIAYPDELDRPGQVSVCGFMPDFLRFDNRFFRVSNADAQLMDPQLRLMLEVGWGALEDAGMGDPARRPATGVFASSTGSAYLRSILSRTELDPVALDKAIHGTEADFLATSLAYRLDLCGPAVTVQTACSSSLVAVHLACRALIDRECDAAMVIAAGLPFPQAGHLFVEGGIKSGVGRCRPFDADADGVIEGTGVVAVVLQRLGDAVPAAPRPYGVILGSATNNDGGAKQGFTAPSLHGQARVIAAALAAADVEPESIGYLECHGTGTKLGDPVEWAAATQVYGDDEAGHPIWIGASKANAGHLDGAAGLLGLVKALQVVNSGQIPPVAGFAMRNPLLDEVPSRLKIPDLPRQWRAEHPRRAGVSAFGVGGTNAHVIVESAAGPAESLPDGGVAMDDVPHLLALSAADPETLARSSAALANHLETIDGSELPGVAHALAATRAPLPYRIAITANTPAAAAAGLRSPPPGARGMWASSSDRPVLLLFSGQGGQRLGAAIPWAKALPGFSRALWELLVNLPRDLADDIAAFLFDPEAPAGLLDETRVAQPALCALALAATAGLSGAGVRFAGAIGHSLGEVAALAAAGGIEPRQALQFAVVRGEAMQRCPPGRMLSVAGPPDAVRAWIEERQPAVEIAAINGAAAVTLAVPEAYVDAAERQLSQRWRTLRLRGNRAFHSRLIDASIPAIEQAAACIVARPLAIPLARNHDGRIEAAGAVPDLPALAIQARSCVRFADGFHALAGRWPAAIAIEVGSGGGLTSLAAGEGIDGVAPGRMSSEDCESGALAALGALWAMGGCGALPQLLCQAERWVRLPPYPFQGPVWVHPSLAPMPCVAARTRAPGAMTEPATPVDARTVLAGAWAGLLGINAVTNDRNFFDAGGDSLTMIRLVAQLRAELSPDIRLQDIADRMTFGEQLTWLETTLPSAVAVATGWNDAGGDS